ncbi:B-box zinc finger protein 20-like [Phoenix dactylifera]|uniref:B-box zinc finger protein 20-like n=1 Tax=Phoenix dactylifera TaxID=42345 RepID=A0A8B7C4Q9_PHODC|nr:B-box zinc finger protein 20-like [Phoenix dactylifera]
MKIQCDVCAAEAASVFCCADEAALCDACDRRIHSANKLAGKHRRLSLLHPTPSSSSPRAPPLCDICQEKRGFLFCQEDRAILCRDCDVPIHTANDLTMNHTRFLLTGVRLSPAPLPSAPPPEAELVDNKSNDKDVKIENCSNKSHDNLVVVAAEEEAACSSSTTTRAAAVDGSNSSSISEYLIKTLPGWHVEDFLTDDDNATAADADADADAFSQVNGDLLRGGGEGLPVWVPQAKYPVVEYRAGHWFQGFVGSKASRQRGSEGSLRVPQMHGNKRYRTAVRYS